MLEVVDEVAVIAPAGVASNANEATTPASSVMKRFITPPVRFSGRVAAPSPFCRAQPSAKPGTTATR